VLKDLFASLPPSLKTVVASLHGYRLQALRYGRETEVLVGEALERDTWSADRWKRGREERLALLLHHAATKVPYYREQWARRRRAGDRASWELLENWPILPKQALRDDPRAFLADGRSGRLFESSTSGSTGTPLRVWQSREMLVFWYALFEARIRRWNGLHLRDRWAHLGGQKVVQVDRRRPPFWVWNQGMNQLYMSTFHISPERAAYYLRAIRRYGVAYAFGYAHALYLLATLALERGLEVPPLKVAISNAEPFYAFEREGIGAAFRCPVRDTYGQAEIVCGASECEAGAMHLWPEVGVVEWRRDGSDEPPAPGEAGRMICTGLLNLDMPLIRYEVGDRSVPGDSGASCACGRSLPLVRSFEGRTFDLMYSPEGVIVGGLDAIFHSGLPMREAQIVQETLSRFRINVVPAPGFGDRHREDLVRELQGRISRSVDVVVETVDAIPRTPAGKFPLQVSLLEERRSAGEAR
jgi:phenylacetate-CoA ligase